ncbi:MAG: COX15/CtaA family protein [Ferruginibacter sp.]
MSTIIQERNNKMVATWLLIGVFMIVIQVLIGGITRLSESGLSITEWKPITGILPPLNNHQWQIEFDKYRNTDQFKYVHGNFQLSDFKFIFFWEWFHRVWARLLGIVFLIGFIYFLIKRKFDKKMVGPMILLFVLGAMQGLVGWLMVKSGLVPEKFYVGHVELTTHFIAALILLAYTLWFALSLMPSFKAKVVSPKLKNFLWIITAVLFIQLIFGGFMAGLRAAQSAPTWPDINGYFIPPTISELHPWVKNVFNNVLTIHFIHRGLAYVLLMLVVYFYFTSSNRKINTLFNRFRVLALILILIQVVLGVFTVLNGTNRVSLAWFGVSHQFIAMLFLICLTCMLFLVKKKSQLSS